MAHDNTSKGEILLNLSMRGSYVHRYFVHGGVMVWNTASNQERNEPQLRLRPQSKTWVLELIEVSTGGTNAVFSLFVRDFTGTAELEEDLFISYRP